MPAHVWPPKHNPPNFWDRVKIHSSDVGLGLLAFVSGLQVLMTPLFRNYAPSMSLTRIEPALGLTLALFVGAGGLVATIGVLWSGRTISTGWVLEEVGWLLAGFGWTGYGLLVAYSFPFSTISYGIALALGFISFTRAYVVYCIDRSIRPGAEVAKQLRQGGDS